MKLNSILLDEIEMPLGNDWLVRHWLPLSGLASMYGPPGCGKSFFALDLGLSVARGVDFFGNRTLPGSVLYCGLEGANGLKKRIYAYRKHHATGRGIPFALATEAINFLDDGETVDAIVGEAALLADATKQPCRLIIIDTLARSMLGDENSFQDMGRLIAACEIIRERTNCLVLLVHHTGKDSSKGARGHSSLFGALDSGIEVENADGIRTATLKKSKDGESAAQIAFRLESIELARLDDEVINSCVVVPSEAPEPKTKAPRAIGIQAIALQSLIMAINEAGETGKVNGHAPANAKTVQVSLWRKYFDNIRAGENPNTNRMAFQRASDALAGSRKVAAWGDHVWICS